MKYRVTTLTDATRHVAALREGRSGEIPFVERESPGADRYQEIEDAIIDLLETWIDERSKITKNQKDGFEGNLSINWFESLQKLPADILTDKDFWRWLSLKLFDFIQWRDGEKSSLASFGAQASTPGWDCVPLRMFNRALVSSRGGAAVDAKDVYELTRVGQATDLWRSHILRVLNGYAPVVVHEMLVDWRDRDPRVWSTDPVREYVKDLRRIRANVLFELLDQRDARDMLDMQRARTLAALDLGGGHD